MKFELKILIVEDNIGDADLLTEYLYDTRLRKSKITHSITLKGAIEELKTKDFDVVLLDFGLPDSEGLSSINRIEKIKPDIPVIIITGNDDLKIGEESITIGVQDYLVKGKFESELLFRVILYAIERKKQMVMLKIANQKIIQHEQKLKEQSEEKYRVMIENSGDAILIRQNGAFVFANKSLLTKLGYSKEEFLKLGNNIIFQQEILTEMDSRFLQNETYQISFETKILNKNETTIDVEVTERVIFYDDTKAQFLTIRDITKQKEIMKILQRGAEQTKGLNEFIPICAGCSLIRDDEKEGKPWVKPAEYISERLPEVKFSHGMCPDCMKKWYPDFVEDKEG